MHVVKRDGKRKPVDFNKITKRINYFCKDLQHVDAGMIAMKVIRGMYSGVTTQELDVSASDIASSYGDEHPEYSLLAGRILISNLHRRNLNKSFSNTINNLYTAVDNKTKRKISIISDECHKFIMENADEIDPMINLEKDLNMSITGYKTLEKSYLLKINGKIVESPQYMFMRAAVEIHLGDLSKIKETYKMMSRGYFTHASPTLFNACIKHPQLSSCFLLKMKEDSVDGIYDTLKRCALISRFAGGIGISVTNIRATGSYIAGTNGTSSGIVPMLRVFNNTARYIDQAGRRKGSFAIYLEPWHSDVFQWIDLKKAHGEEEGRARDLFYALWVPDLFMKRVKADGMWSLFCPHEVKEYFNGKSLQGCYGDEFDVLYVAAEKVAGLARKTIKARTLWKHICKSQTETGGPFICYKDAANKKSNQKHTGMINSSNLCTEIFQHTSADETAVCNLASIALPILADVNGDEWKFDFEKLADITRIITTNLNNVIDRSFYPIESAKKANQTHRPIGIGVQGLSDLLQKMGIEHDSDKARTLFSNIVETMYYNALVQSCELAKEFGPYESFEGSPASKGILQPDMWDEKWKETDTFVSIRKWDALRSNIIEHGLRNNSLIALMPTASSSNILGNSECFEVRSSNLYIKKLLSGEYIALNKYLVSALEKENLWTDVIRKKIIARGGSVRTIKEIPLKIKNVFKTVWEISGKSQIDMIASAAKYIDHSSSMSLYFEKIDFGKLTSAHFYGWKKGLKTGMYYLRSQPAVLAIKFALEDEFVKEAKISEQTVKEAKISEQTAANNKLPKKKKKVRLFVLEKDECTTCSA